MLSPLRLFIGRCCRFCSSAARWLVDWPTTCSVNYDIAFTAEWARGHEFAPFKWLSVVGQRCQPVDVTRHWLQDFAVHSRSTHPHFALQQWSLCTPRRSIRWLWIWPEDSIGHWRNECQLELQLSASFSSASEDHDGVQDETAVATTRLLHTPFDLCQCLADQQHKSRRRAPGNNR